MNSVCIIGRLTKDVELKTTDSGLSALSMFIAINNGKDKAGNDKPADFPKVVVYDKQAENVSKYCHRGSLVAIDGRIKTRTWDKNDGSKGYETYIVASRVQFLDSKQSSANNDIPEPDYIPQSELTTSAESVEITQSTAGDPFADFGEEVNLDDLPF